MTPTSISSPLISSFVSVNDAYGIPALRIHMSWSDTEHAMTDDMAATAVRMLDAAGANHLAPVTTRGRPPGNGIHEVRVARMGNDPQNSVLNQFQQTHDIKNLFVVDGAGFPSSARQNPTLTIMALAVRSCDYLMSEMKRGNI